MDCRLVSEKKPFNYIMNPSAFNLRCRTLLLCVLLSACSLRQFHPTPVDALIEISGMVVGSLNDPSSLQVLQQQEVAGGTVLLYRWQRTATQLSNTFCLVATFVTHEGRGWRAQSSGFFSDGASGRPTCTFTTTSDFRVGYYVEGNITALTTAYRWRTHGSHVHITWSDGVVSQIPVHNQSFLESQPETLQVERIELRDTNDTVLAEEAF
jgi:hypothetical protein